MGNWRTVHLTGSCDAAEVGPLRAALIPDDTWSNFGPLSITEGLCGLGDWPAEQIDARGNLAERDYTVADVAEHLNRLLEVAPSLRLVVHCGDDWESSQCVATIDVRDGQVTETGPEVPAVLGVDETTMTTRLLGHLVKTATDNDLLAAGGVFTHRRDAGLDPQRRSTGWPRTS